ncbi:hypothetical protein JCM10213_006271 [Rhodosporidiobolus nylandii]
MAPILPYELLLIQHEALELSESCFALPGELVLAEETAALLPTLRDWLDAGGADTAELEQGGDWTDELVFTLNLSLELPTPTPTHPLPLSLTVSVPLVQPAHGRPTTPEGAPFATVNVHQPPWLSRAGHEQLCASLPAADRDTCFNNAEFVMQVTDRMREMAVKLRPKEEEKKEQKNGKTEENEPEFRVWCWFPSLSTREKRDDIVNWAPEYNVTGFVLAGKPALLCMEGTEKDIQAYLADIKANSWADIPSFQKKVSERYRSPLLLPSAPRTPGEDPTTRRLFVDMVEITDKITHGGHRGQRGDMGEVKDYLEKVGLGEAFGIVIGGGQFA